MPQRLRVPVAIGVVLVAAFFAWRHYASPERRVLARLDALMKQLSKEGGESQLVAAATARGVADFFASGFFVRADPYEGQLEDARDLTGAVMRFRGAGERIEAAASDTEVLVDETAGTAIVHFVGNVTLDAGRGPARESWRVRSLWVEDADEWKIAELELLEQLEAGGLLQAF